MSEKSYCRVRLSRSVQLVFIIPVSQGAGGAGAGAGAGAGVNCDPPVFPDTRGRNHRRITTRVPFELVFRLRRELALLDGINCHIANWADAMDTQRSRNPENNYLVLLSSVAGVLPFVFSEFRSWLLSVDGHAMFSEFRGRNIVVRGRRSSFCVLGI